MTLAVLFAIVSNQLFGDSFNNSMVDDNNTNNNDLGSIIRHRKQATIWRFF